MGAAKQCCEPSPVLGHSLKHNIELGGSMHRIQTSSLSLLSPQMSSEIFPVKAITIIFIIHTKNNKDNVENYSHCDDANND